MDAILNAVETAIAEGGGIIRVPTEAQKRRCEAAASSMAKDAGLDLGKITVVVDESIRRALFGPVKTLEELMRQLADTHQPDLWPPEVIAPHLLRVPQILGRRFADLVTPEKLAQARADILVDALENGLGARQNELPAGGLTELQQLLQKLAAELPQDYGAAAVVGPEMSEIQRAYRRSELTFAELFRRQPAAFLPPPQSGLAIAAGSYIRETSTTGAFMFIEPTALLKKLTADERVIDSWPPEIFAPYLERIPEILGERMDDIVTPAGLQQARADFLRDALAQGLGAQTHETDFATPEQYQRLIDHMSDDEPAGATVGSVVEAEYQVGFLTFAELFNFSPGDFLPLNDELAA